MKKYEAFISYRHTEPDKTIAEKLHKMLETFRVPSSIAKKIGKRKINRIFRDRDELPTSSNLASSIEVALINAEYLIVICSPRTPQSQWVLKEIETFSKLHGHGKILALLIEGEPSESFPEQLRFIPKQTINDDGTITEELIEVEPLAADIRGKNLKEMSKKLKTEILRLLAPILGCHYDDLKQRHRERFIKRVVTVSVSAALFFLAFGSFSAWQALKLKLQVDKTLRGQSLYLSDLSKQLLEEGDRRTAILLALEALPINLEHPERPYVEEAEYALSQALAAYKTDYYFVSDIALNHRKGITDIKISDDGSKVFTVCNDGNIYLWNTENGELLHSFPYDTTFIDEGNTFFTKDGTAIVSLTDRGAAAWDINSGTTLWELEGYFNHIALNPDGKTIALSSDMLHLIDIKTGTELFSLPISNLDDGYVYSLQFNNDGSKIAVGTNNGLTLVFDTINQKELYSLSCTYEYVYSLAFSHDGNKIAAVSNYFDTSDPLSKGKGSLQIWSANDGSALATIHVDSSSIKYPIFSPKDSNIVIFTEDEIVRVINATTKEMLYSFTHGDAVHSVIVTKDGDFIVAATYDGNIQFYSLQNGMEIDWWRLYQNTPIRSMDMGNGLIATASSNANKAYIWKMIEAPNLTRLEGHSTSIRSGKFSNDGKKALTFDYDESAIYVWDIEQKTLISKLTGLEGVVVDACFDPTDTKIISLSEDGYLRLWELSTLKELTSIPAGEFTDYRYNADGTFAAFQTGDGIKVLDILQCKEVLTISDYSFISDFLFSGNGNNLLVIDWDGNAYLYDIQTGEIIHSFSDLILRKGAFNKDSTLLALAGENGIYLFDMSTFKEICHIEAPNLSVVSMAFNYNGSDLLVGLDDKTIQVYDVKTGQWKAELTGHRNNLSHCIYREAGNLLITIGEYGDSIFWNASNYKKLAQIDRILDIDSHSKTILSSHNSEVILMPHYDTNALKEEARKQLGNRELSEEEKIKYYIIE